MFSTDVKEWGPSSYRADVRENQWGLSLYWADVLLCVRFRVTLNKTSEVQALLSWCFTMCLFQTTVKCMFQTAVKEHQSSLGFIKLTSDYMFQTAVKEQRSQGFYQAAVVMCVCLRLQSKLTQYVKVLLKCWCVCVCFSLLSKDSNKV